MVDVYYAVKPWVPRRLLIQVRSMVIERKRRRIDGRWPIDPRAVAGKPEPWRGWPQQKAFALVLTHDVESIRGVEKCLDLVELEKRLGFRSSFNFVGGDYHVPPALLETLRQEGYEIGVHGLHHTGNLFESRREFLDQAGEINARLKSWGAVGFRCPSMYHNLEWIHDLDLEYDLSTFDTDPFEPQSDGVGTIYPFRVAKNGSESEGYIELPYTIPQDFTVFVLMREKGIGIWKEKLAWIARNQGAALLNVHPDYMHFGRGRRACDEYPAQLYEEFLSHVAAVYEGRYWNALPKDVARFWQTEVVQRRSESASALAE